MFQFRLHRSSIPPNDVNDKIYDLLLMSFQYDFPVSKFISNLTSQQSCAYENDLDLITLPV